MDDDALQIYHDPKAHRDDLRAVIDSQEIEIARLRAELARAANGDPTTPLPLLPGIDGKPKTPNDRVDGRDAASSRRVPSHDGLCGNGSEVGAGGTASE